MGTNATQATQPLAALTAREGVSPYLSNKTCQAQWELENKEAIAQYNQRVQTEGLWCDDERTKVWNTLGK